MPQSQAPSHSILVVSQSSSKTDSTLAAFTYLPATGAFTSALPTMLRCMVKGGLGTDYASARCLSSQATITEEEKQQEEIEEVMNGTQY